jgi:hypothetical protein
MAHFAKIDENNIVTRVIVAEQEFINTQPGRWIQCSYNTVGGVHLLGGTPLRKNFPSEGYYYNETIDGFIPPCQYQNWLLDETKGMYVPPTPNPGEGWDSIKYVWDDNNVTWRLRSEVFEEHLLSLKS